MVAQYQHGGGGGGAPLMVVRSWRGDLTERGAAKHGVCGAWPMVLRRRVGAGGCKGGAPDAWWTGIYGCKCAIGGLVVTGYYYGNPTFPLFVHPFIGSGLRMQ